MTKSNSAIESSTLGERIKQIISEIGMKQTAFAKSLGVSANYIYLLTSEKKTSISVPLAKLIESTYGYPAQWLMTGENQGAMPLHPNLHAETIRKIKSMSGQELQAVSVFIRSLEKNGS